MPLEKEKAPGSEATLTGAEDVQASSLLTDENTTKPLKGQGRIEAMLLRGEKYAIPTRDLVERAGAHSARDLQSEIEAERAAGALILSKGGKGGGYFLPAAGETGRREIAAFIRTLNARAVSTQRTLKAARRALAELDGQAVMEEVRQ